MLVTFLIVDVIFGKILPTSVLTFWTAVVSFVPILDIFVLILLTEVPNVFVKNVTLTYDL